MVWMVIGGAVVVIVLAILLSRARVPHDGVDNFRRQIDALSPEARRPVVGRVNEARQTTRDHGLTVRRVNPVAPTHQVDGSLTDHHPEFDEGSADRRTGQESGRASDGDGSSGLSSGDNTSAAAGDSPGAFAGDDDRGDDRADSSDLAPDVAPDVDGGAAGESLDGA